MTLETVRATSVMRFVVFGAVGFGVGLIVGVFALQGMFGVRFMAGTWGTVILCALAGTSGGASLGAALGSLENRKLEKQRRPRVR